MSQPAHDSARTLHDLRASGKLPSPQGVALAIMELTRDVNASMDALARLIRTDPALCGRLICAANSIRHGTRRAVASVPDAVTVLGIAAVRQLALGFSLVTHFRGGVCRSFDYDAFWSRSLLLALAAPAFGAQARCASADELFVCGLLARVGRLGLATVHPAAYSAVIDAHRLDPAQGLESREAAAFGITGTELTAALLEEWGIPRHLVDPLRHHEEAACPHFPEGSRGASLREVLHVASWFADLCMAPEGERRCLLPQLFLRAAPVGLPADRLIALGDTVVAEWRDWSKLFAVPGHDIKAYAALAAELPAADPAAEAAPPSRLRVLVIDDDRSVTARLRELLGGEYDVHVAHDGKTGIARALDIEPHILITDWLMPDMDGTELCRALRDAAVGRGIYMLIMTAQGDDARTVQALEAGADDVLVKPLRSGVVSARLQAARRVWRLREEIERDRGEIRRFAGELVMANRRLQDSALSDPVTALPNRRYAMDRVAQEWAAATRGGAGLACVAIGMDRIKEINDSYGYDAGDFVLREVAQRMRTAARRGDVLCRIGGGEFMMVCPNATLEAARQCAERLRQAVAASPVHCLGCAVAVSVSTGVAVRSHDMAAPADLILAADRALESARQPPHLARRSAAA